MGSLNAFPELKLKARLGDIFTAATGSIASGTDGEQFMGLVDISKYGGKLELKGARASASEDFSAAAASADGILLTIKAIDSVASQVIGIVSISIASANTAHQSIGDFTKGRANVISITDVLAFPNKVVSADSDILCVWNNQDADVVGPINLELELDFEPVNIS